MRELREILENNHQKLCFLVLAFCDNGFNQSRRKNRLIKKPQEKKGLHVKLEISINVRGDLR